MRSSPKLWLVSAVFSILLVSVAFWNVVIHENGWNLTFVIWPGLLVGFFVGVNYHNGFDRTESIITFAASAAFWIIFFFAILSLVRAGLQKKEEKKSLTKPPENNARDVT